MRKCSVDEVPDSVIVLAVQCAEGVQFNWEQFLCNELLTNCQEDQDEGKTFHYAWLLLPILLVTGELPQDSQFPSITNDLPEAMRYLALCGTRDTTRVSGS